MRFDEKLEALKTANLHRTLKTLSAPQGRRTVVNGKEALLFSSSNYLGLAEEPGIIAAAAEAAAFWGTGSGGSRLTTGNMVPHMRLEAVLANFKGTESAVLFNCGYMANVGAIAALCGEGDTIFSDSLNHASIIDGCRLSKAKTIVYAHNDVNDLAAKITAARPVSGMIVTDGVFSMDGDIAPLADLADIARKHNLLLMVDDAHATGVIGKTGKGSLEYHGLSTTDVPVVMGTLSKAIPSEGGFVCASETICDYLKNTARSFIYSTSLAPGTVATSIAALEHVRANPACVRTLQNNIAYMAMRLREEGLFEGSAETAILPVIIGDEAKAAKISSALFDNGVFVPCIRFPTVKRGQAMLRFTVMATHTKDDMECAVKSLKNVMEK